MKPPPGTIVLGFHPTTRGFGWVAFSSPLVIHDWGVCYTRKEKNVRCLRRFERLLAQLGPGALVLEEFDGTKPRRTDRVVMLCRAVVHMGMEQGLEVAVIPHKGIERCFEAVGARTQDEIAAAISRTHPSLLDQVPKRRQHWDQQRPRMSLFCASAAVIAHYQLSSSRLLEKFEKGGLD